MVFCYFKISALMVVEARDMAHGLSFFVFSVFFLFFFFLTEDLGSLYQAAHKLLGSLVPRGSDMLANTEIKTFS